jgi:hypothetical protein
MATTLQKDDIVKAAREMTDHELLKLIAEILAPMVTQQRRLKLIAEIAALPDDESLSRTAEIMDAPEDFDEEVMKTSRQIMDKYSNLLRRLAK